MPYSGYKQWLNVIQFSQQSQPRCRAASAPGPVNDFRASGLATALNHNLQLRQLFASVQSAANQQRDSPFGCISRLPVGRPIESFARIWHFSVDDKQAIMEEELGNFMVLIIVRRSLV